MNAEILYLYTIFTTNRAPELLKRMDARKYMGNKSNQEIFLLSLALHKAKMPINEENLTKIIHRSNTERTRAEKIVEKVREIYKLDKVPPVAPYEALRESYYNGIVKSNIDLIQTNPNIEQYKQFVKQAYDKLNFNSGDKWTTFGEEIEKLREELKTGKEPQTFNKVPLKSYAMKEIFGTHMISQKYDITGVPGGYKTTLLHNLMLDMLQNEGVRGAYLSMEDLTAFSARKLLATAADIDKGSLIMNNKITEEQIDEAIKVLNVNSLYIKDNAGTATEIYEWLYNLIVTEDIKWFCIDFYQMVRREKGQTETDAIAELNEYIHQLITEFQVCGVCLSQTTATIARDVMSGGKFLQAGTEMGSAKIFQTARNSYYLTPVTKELIRVVCGKRTLDGKKDINWNLKFRGYSGTIDSIEEVEAT